MVKFTNKGAKSVLTGTKKRDGRNHPLNQHNDCLSAYYLLYKNNPIIINIGSKPIATAETFTFFSHLINPLV